MNKGFAGFPAPSPSGLFPIGPIPAVGEFQMPAFATEAQSSGAFVLNSLQFSPFMIRADMTFDNMSIYCNTGQASNTLRVGLYTASEDCFPEALINDAGTFDTSSSGAKSLALSWAFRANTLYYIGCVSQGGTSATIRTTGSTWAGWTTTDGNNGQWSGAPIVAATNSVSGALPGLLARRLFTPSSGGAPRTPLLYFLRRSV